MKKILTLFVFMLFFLYSFSQQKANLVIFCEEGLDFVVMLNGVKQNPFPESNVKISGLDQEVYNVQIIFSDPMLPQIRKSVFVSPGYETVLTIRKNRIGALIMRYLSQSPLKSKHFEYEKNSVAFTTTATDGGGDDDNGQFKMDVRFERDGVEWDLGYKNDSLNADVNVGGRFDRRSRRGGRQYRSYDWEPQNKNNDYDADRRDYYNDNNADDDFDTESNHDNYRKKRTERAGNKMTTKNAMSSQDFNEAIKSIEKQDYESTRLTVAKQITRINCLTTNQIKEILLMFDFESTRLEYAKFAYDYTFDKDNYFKINDVFSFQSSVNELEEYITSHK